MTQTVAIQHHGGVSGGDTYDKSIPVFRDTKIEGSISTNVSFLFTINFLGVNNSTSTLFYKNISQSGQNIQLRLISFNLRVPEGGIINLYFEMTNTSQIGILRINLDTKNNLGSIFFPYLYILMGIMAVASFMELKGKTRINIPEYYGASEDSKFIEVLFPSFFAMIIFSFKIRIIDGSILSIAIEEITAHSKLYAYLYWGVIIWTGRIYFNRRATEVRYLWTTFRGRERTVVYRIYFAFRTLFSVFVQAIGLYYLLFIEVVLNFNLELNDIIQIVKFVLLLSSNAWTHLIIFGLFSFFAGRWSEVSFFITQIIIDVLLSRFDLFTTYTFSTIQYITNHGLDYVITAFSILLSFPLIGIYYIYYLNSEVIL